MKKFNYKSRKGFTLIELLVVIGILAVLAAIAIPSVAGLIDRANVSADNTNVNEMTNAMERFVSEYELYCQDIASGTLKDGDGDGVPDNMDAAQGRVYNVTKAVTRSDIEKLESAMGFNGIRIDIDSKYAQNSKTAKAVMQNYMKTSSSTFEPKQSDMTYWYHVLTGYTVVAPKNIDIVSLSTYLPQNIVNGTENEFFSHWIDLSTETNIPDLQIIGAYYRAYQSGNRLMGFYINIPNPKYNDVDYSKIFILMNKESDGELTISNNEFVQKMQDALTSGNIDYMENNNAPINRWSKSFWLTQEETGDIVRQFRVAYQYEVNGETFYQYTPVYKASYNQLVSENKAWQPPK